MPNDPQSTVETKRKRAIQETGHWQMPLDGHGLAYFDELTVAYRTTPPHGSTEDPWARAMAKAAKDVEDAAAALDAAEKMAVPAVPPVAPIPGPPVPAQAGNPNIASASAATPADAKAKLIATAKAGLEEAKKAEALAKGSVDSKFAAAAIIEGLLRKKEVLDLHQPGGAIWSDILTFESALLRMMWFEPLKTKLYSLRQEYRLAVGATAAQGMEATYLDLKSVTEHEDFHRLQAEAANLMAELHWSLVTAPALESEKTFLTLKLGCYALALGVCILLTCLRTDCSPASGFWGRPLVEVLFSLHFHCSTLALVMLAGAAGATLSAYQRIHVGGTSGAGLLNLRKSRWNSLNWGLAPLIGATSALLLTLIFAGNIISGNFFPKVTLRADDGGTNTFPHVTMQPGTNTITSLLSHSNTVSAGNSPTNANPLNITNSTPATNQVNTNTPILTNPPAGTADPATWRDDKTFCQHRWCVASGADLALLFIWAFIAGFSERLVPDMLSRLAKKAEEKV